MTNKLSDLADRLPDRELSPSAPDVIDNPRKARPKTVQQILEYIDVLTYEDQARLYELFKEGLANLTAERIIEAEHTISVLREFHGGLNDQPVGAIIDGAGDGARR